MRKNLVSLFILVGLLGCSSPQKIVTPTHETAITKNLVKSAKAVSKDPTVNAALNACNTTMDSQNKIIMGQAELLASYEKKISEQQEQINELSIKAGGKEEIDDSRRYNMFMLIGVFATLALLIASYIVWKIKS
jgi:uncharacterized protein YcfL